MATDTFLHPVVDGTNPNVDIVAVHGLNPTNKASHAELTWTAGGKLWLRDFLPKRLPRARVLLFGYNSNVAFETSTAGVLEQAENLLNLLDLHRKADENRPIIFVAHSLGGIVVKRALVEAKLNDKYGAIRASTFGIAFFATPHRGGNNATLGNIVAKIAKTVMWNPGNTFMDHLKKNSLFTENLTNEFKHQYEDYSILSFYETRGFKNTANVVVEKESAVLGLAGTRETAIALNLDHSQICKFDEINEVYKQVEENIFRLAESAVQHSMKIPNAQVQSSSISHNHEKSFFLVPHAENAGFVGRDALFNRLVQRLSAHAGPRSRAALFGLGGVGKTQIAIRYAYWLHAQQADTSIFWIYASNVERFRHSFLELAQNLDIPGADSPKVEILALVKEWLERKETGKWLMIIDNADDFEMFFDPQNTNGKVHSPKLADYIPDCPHGSVLVTTRDKKVAVRVLKNTSPLSLINVLPMGQAEAAELVHQVLAGEDYSDEDVRRLTQSLEYIPLAITQAAAFILENCISIPIYIQRYMDNKDDAIELLSHDFEALGRDEETHNAVTTTWMLSFKQIRDQTPYAADILSLMAFLDRHCIPEELLRKYREPNSSTDFEKACGTLKAFSLTEENPMTIAGKPHRAFSMHRMVQLVTRQWLVHHNESRNWADNSLIVVSKVFPPGERENWDRCEVYLPQVQMVLESNNGSEAGAEFKADLLHNASSYFRVKGYHGRAEQVGREAVEMRQKLLGNSHPDTILSLTSLSRVHMEQGRLDDAITVQQSAVTATMLDTKGVIGDNIHAKHHIEANLHATRHLAAIYGIQGQYGKAEKLELQVVDESKRLLGEDHPDTLLAMRDLAVTYGCLGRPDDAKPLHQHVLNVRKRVLGDDHPETLISMSDLAVTYCQQDPLKNASKVELLESFVVEARKRVLGNQHPNTLQAMRDLAIVYELQNRDDEAESIRSEILEESLRAKKMRAVSFRAMSDGVVTYQQQSLSEIVRKVIGDNWRSIRSKPNMGVPKINASTAVDELSGKSEVLVSTTSIKLELPNEDSRSVKGVGRPRWHRRLLSFDGRSSKHL
ncbi:hypothetical protein B0J14DRAFT_571676 [Halenospora varia]|nr:hypothetical protein B0J14DRAFT_571676 [Halenospora varia]